MEPALVLLAGVPYVRSITRQETRMVDTLILYLAVPATALFLLQSLPDIKGLLDFGATAALAAYMVWLWNRHTMRWQDKQEKVDEVHRAALEHMATVQAELLTRLVDRYDQHVQRLVAALERNSASGNRVAEVLDGSAWCKCSGEECRENCREAGRSG